MSAQNDQVTSGTDAKGTNLTMSLHDLPAPSFKAGPLGQRSVPALEKPTLFAGSLAAADTSESRPRTPTAGTLTPGASGNLGLGQEPWTLFSSNEEASKGGNGWKDVAKNETAIPRPVSSLARSTSYSGDASRIREISKKPALNRADTQSNSAQGKAEISPIQRTAGSAAQKNVDDLASNFGSLGLGPIPASVAQPQQAWSDQRKPSYPNQNGFYNSGFPSFSGAVEPSAFSANPLDANYDIFRRDSGYGASLDYMNQNASAQGGMRRAQSAWQVPGPEQQQQRIPARAQSGRYGPSNMSRTGSGASMYNLDPRSQMQGAYGYQTQAQPAANQFYSMNMFSQAPAQSRNMQSASFGRQNYDSANNGMIDYSAYGASPYPTGLVSGANGGLAQDYSQGMPGSMRYEDRVRNARSPLLEEFRANRHRRWDLSDLRGHVVEFSGDQLGSRHLQTKLDSATVEDKRLFFEELLPNVLPLSADLFSNYVVQKAFEIADHNQKLALVKALEGNVLQLSMQMYGCRVVQKALECVLVDEQVVLVNELRGNVLKCARDQISF